MAATIAPNLGLIFDIPPIALPLGALQDGLNFRVKKGLLEALNLGWVKFSDNWTLDGPVLLIDNYFPRDSEEKLIFGTNRDLYLYDANADTVSFLNPIYAAGTASASGTAVTGVGTNWDPSAKSGDFISFGSATENDPNATWFEIDTVNNDTSITLTTSAGVVANGPYTIRTTFIMSPTDGWAVDTFVNDGTTGDDLWIATDGQDFVISWDGAASTVVFHPEMNFTCKTLAVYSNMMIYGNITYAGEALPQDIINSDVGFPLLAGDVGTGLSEQFTAYNGTDQILNMLALGDYLVIYGERTLVPVQFVGDPLIFIFRVAISGVGPIAPNAIADFGDFHEFIGADAGYMFDGVTLKETGSHVWREVLRQTDPMRRRQAYGHFDEEQGDLIWSVPNNSDANVGQVGAPGNIAWVEHYLEDAGHEAVDGSPFSKRTFPFLATGFFEQATGTRWQDISVAWRDYNYAWNDQFFQAGFPLNLAGDENGQIYTLNTAQDGDGVVLPNYVRFGRVALRSGRERDLLTRIYPWTIRLPYNLEVSLFMADHVAGSMSAKGVANFDMNQPEGGHFVTFYRRGRVFEIMLGSSIGDPWQLHGWDYDTVNGGMR